MPKNPLYLAWKDVLDCLGDPVTWGPMKSDYRKALWCPTLNYRNRLLIASFCYQNGCNLSCVVTFLEKLGREKKKIDKIKALFVYWNDSQDGQQRRANFWSYNMYLGCFADLNDKPRCGQEKYIVH